MSHKKYIKRLIKIKDWVEDNKVLILYGPRQVGKTTLLKAYLNPQKSKYLYKTGDDIPFANELSQCDLTVLRNKLSSYSLIAIDEAQKIPRIGRALKLIVDNLPNIKVIVTGSSSFDLLNHTGEALTGRKKTITLYPLALSEVRGFFDSYDFEKLLPQFLIYGMYPDVLLANSSQQKAERVTELAHSYLLKDILDFDKVKSSKKIFDLLRLLAFQVGSQVSTNELANTLGVDKNTVAHHLDLLEKSFVLFRLEGFSRNLRKEVSKMSKYYFYDLGIRNALISNFNPMDLRNDAGQLWENFMLIERIKSHTYQKIHSQYYFWRTYDKKEIDLIEERNGKLFAYEFKYKASKNKIPKDWINTYQNSEYHVVTPQNYIPFLDLEL